MPAEISKIPTPSEWVESKLREQKMSNAALARIIGHDRTQVQRWINGREQIPRHHLAEIAIQLGTHTDLEYALKLKECEDSADSLKRKIRELARIGRFDATGAQQTVFAMLEQKTDEEEHHDKNIYASALMYNMAHASFIFRLWQEAAATRDFSRILTSHNLKLHLRYPANHFLGLALNLEQDRGLMPEFRDQCLRQIRDLAVAQGNDNPLQVSHWHHAIHVLGRFGSPDDQARVSEQLFESAASVEPIAIRLGYAGLTLQAGNEDLVEKYLWLLQRNETLAAVDITFDAVHYGDAGLTRGLELPENLGRATRTVANILRRLTHPEQYANIRELDTFRLREILLCCSPDNIPDQSLGPKIISALAQPLAANRNRYTADAEALLSKLLDNLNRQHPE
jgi:plasmid maintenance system antidote protein VapI